MYMHVDCGRMKVFSQSERKRERNIRNDSCLRKAQKLVQNYRCVSDPDVLSWCLILGTCKKISCWFTSWPFWYFFFFSAKEKQFSLFCLRTEFCCQFGHLSSVSKIAQKEVRWQIQSMRFPCRNKSNMHDALIWRPLPHVSNNCKQLIRWGFCVRSSEDPKAFFWRLDMDVGKGQCEIVMFLMKEPSADPRQTDW